LIKWADRTMKIILFVAIWSSIFIAYNFIGLCLNDGELLVTEPVGWLRWFEMVLSVFIAVLVTGIGLGYLTKRQSRKGGLRA